jgi:acid phosphatase
MPFRVRSAVYLCVVSIATGAACSRTPPPAPAAPPARVTHELLDPVLWMQTSGEYWALATTAYRAARRGLDDGLKTKAWTAATEQTPPFTTKPPAVIFDLDETVLDNSAYEGQLVKNGTGYDDALWTEWANAKRAAAIPGAVDFVNYVRSKHVAVFFITNRSASSKAVTMDNLKALGLAPTDDTVLCKDDGGSSDKTERRARVAKAHRILLLVGDDLNDFVAANTLDPAHRRGLAQQYADRWGSKWILLPNAMYGGWEQAITKGITDDAGQLAAKTTLVRSFK